VRTYEFAVLLLFGCGSSSATTDAPVGKDSSPPQGDASVPHLVYGDSATVYGQTVKTYGLVDGNAVLEAGFIIPMAVGAAADGQPAGTVDGWGPLNFPAEVKANSVLDHATIDFFRDGIASPWNHAFFGVHAFQIDAATQQAVACPAPMSPPAAEVPPGYNVLPTATYPAGGCIAGEGLHAVDTTSPEMQTPAKPFTVNLWLGFSPTTGHWTFFESFVTDSFLTSGTEYEEDVRVPQTYPATATGKFFPGRLRAVQDGTNWKLYYDAFVYSP
jgi:hypothetical protein